MIWVELEVREPPDVLEKVLNGETISPLFY